MKLGKFVKPLIIAVIILVALVVLFHIIGGNVGTMVKTHLGM